MNCCTAPEALASSRRWRAAQRAGQHRVPIVALEVNDDEALQLAIIENVQRADLGEASCALARNRAERGNAPKRAYSPLSALTDRTVEMFCPMRQRTPAGSTSTKSRIPQGRSSGGSVFVSYLDAIP
jgi:ParB-like nuclease family protein